MAARRGAGRQPDAARDRVRACHVRACGAARNGGWGNHTSYLAARGSRGRSRAWPPETEEEEDVRLASGELFRSIPRRRRRRSIANSAMGNARGRGRR
uniref:Uncharacterized protein n=1 Tax=Oryza sativa subsp. japonica TaxID=39947 RepID=Q6ZBK7_ORYSJ|nr:hypothetical protein [Oryza sativa Japonica Group]